MKTILEKLKKHATNLMLRGAYLYTQLENLEKDLTDDILIPAYKHDRAENCYKYIQQYTKSKFHTKMDENEQALWEELIKASGVEVTND